MRKITCLFTIMVAMAVVDTASAQAVFTNGIDVMGSFIVGNGMVTIESTSNAYHDISTRHIAPSIGQMAGYSPDTGSNIVFNGDLLTVRPRILDLSSAANREFVISAAQILGSSNLQISYSGSNIVFSVPADSISTTELDLSALDGRYVEQDGDTMNHTLSIESPSSTTPSIELAGPSSRYKFMRFRNSTDGTIWDISMDASNNRLAIWHSADGTNWTVPFYINTNGVLHADGAGLTNMPDSAESDTLNSILARGNTSSIPLIVGSAGVTNVIRGDALSLDGGDLNHVRSIGDTSRDLEWVTFGTNSSFHNGVYWYFENNASNWWGMARGIGNTLRISQDIFSRNPSIELYTNGLVRIWTDNHIDLRGALKQGYEHNFALGAYSHAAGYLTESIGDYSHSEGQWTRALGKSSHAEGIDTEASGLASHAAGQNAKATNDNTFVWSDGTEVSSTASNQFTVHASNGIRLLGGPISGDGSALTNLQSSADDLGNHTATQNLNMGGFSITNATYCGDGSQLTGIQVPDNLGDHTATANIEMSLAYRIVNLPDPVDAQDAVNYQSMTNHVNQTIACIPEMGDLSMGIYTNQP